MQITLALKIYLQTWAAIVPSSLDLTNIDLLPFSQMFLFYLLLFFFVSTLSIFQF